MKSTQKNSRRLFLKNAAGALAAFTIVPRHVLGGTGYLAPSDTLTKAVIGVGGMGRGHFEYAGTKTVAVCDVDTRHIQLALDALGGGNGVKTFRDYRELITLPEVDIVHIATPPHWHGI
ncbi:MAG TPA: Gfo/Idh/MocA family oxidoreductase, partial [Agriterribacter sp.]|nr:Gfo/Idh/MocA family oxidoreductase [Agriterribacter sp.]